MRPESRKSVTVRGKEIGGKYPFICLPIVAEDTKSLLEQARDLAGLQPDLIEWRVDGFAAVKDIDKTKEALSQLRAVIGNIPLIFTCRHIREGGIQDVPESIRTELFIETIKTGLADIIDVEISSGEDVVSKIKEAIGQYGGKLILSYHNFKSTPEEKYIVEKLKEGAALGADISKLAAMPLNYRDVLTLLSATLKARTEEIDIPIITMSMGEMGGITRLGGGLFGSDVSFAIGRKASAPGQIPVAELRNVWQTLPF